MKDLTRIAYNGRIYIPCEEAEAIIGEEIRTCETIYGVRCVSETALEAVSGCTCSASNMDSDNTVTWTVSGCKEGDYKITYAVQGHEFKVHTTKNVEEGRKVDLMFTPEDIHVMSKMGY